MKTKLTKKHTGLLLFIAIFVGIGTYLLINSFAATAPPTTANLWIDSLSGTHSCIRSSSGEDYSAASSTTNHRVCSSLQSALNASSANDKIIMKTGTYTGTSLSGVSKTSTVTVFVEDGGTATFTDRPEWTGVNNVVLDGTKGANGQGFNIAKGFNIGSNGGVDVTNFTISGAITHSGLYMLSCSNVTVSHIEISDVTNDDGVQLGAWYPTNLGHTCKNVTFDHVYMHHLTGDCGVDHQDGFQVRGGQTIIVKNSLITDLQNCGSQGWFVNPGDDITTPDPDDMQLINTVISNINGNAINYCSVPVTMKYNTILGGLNTSTSIAGCKGNTTFVGNIVSDCTGKNNYFTNKGTGTWGGNVYSSGCSIPSGDTTDYVMTSGSVTDNLVNAPGLDFHLKPGAFAIDKAANSACPVTDADDNNRPVGSACDAGAYEYGSSATPPTGPTANLWVNTTAGATPSKCSPACSYDPTKAYSSFSAAMSAASNSDVIGINDGSYPAQTISGTKTVTFKGDKSKVTLASLSFATASGQTVDGVHITGGLDAKASNNLTVRNSEINNQTYMEATNNMIYDNIMWQFAPGQTTISNGDFVDIYPDRNNVPNTNITIQNSTFHGLRTNNPTDHPDAIQSYNNSSVSSPSPALAHKGIKILRNKFYDNECINLRFNPLDEVLLENNVFGDSVVGVSGCGSYSIDVGFSNTTARYNTFTGVQQIQQTPTSPGLHQTWIGNVGNGFSAGCGAGGATDATLKNNIWTSQSCTAADKKVTDLLLNSDGTPKASSPVLGCADQTDYPATDVNGLSRPQGTTVDAGAFESTLVGTTCSGTPTPKPGDTNNDNVVNIIDLSTLLSKWNTNTPAADFNKDNTVNIFDLSILLSNYGK